MKGRAIQYSAEELSFIEWRQAMSRRALHREFVRRFDRSDVTLAQIKALCKRKGWMTGRTGHFDKGQEPPNKGRKGVWAPGCEKGWFRKGERRGVAVRLYKPIGTERVSKDGYLERKIHDGLPLQSRWRAVHLIEWEKVNGPLPDGHCLKCLDGDKTNVDASNWEALPRALLPRLNGRYGRDYDAAEPELKPTILAIAKLEHEARKATRGAS